jgi:flagellar M-ring protein FliF
MATSTNEKNTSNANYAVPRKIQVVDKPSGSIKRMTVAVVVDGYYTKAPNSTTETFAPRTEDELRRIQDLVANAVGFDAQRRDSITVSSMPFNNTELNVPEAEPAPGISLQNLKMPLIRNGLIALVLMSFMFMVLRPFLKWITGADEKRKLAEAELTTVPRTVEELEAAVQASAEGSVSASEAIEDALSNRGLVAQMEKNDEENNVIRDIFSETESKKEEKRLKNLIMEQLEKSPKKGVRIIQEWIEEDAERKAEGIAA